MNRTLNFLIVGFSCLITHAVFADYDLDLDSPQSLSKSAISVLPILFFLVVLIILVRRQTKSPLAKLQQQYLESQMQHTQRLEALLERIATALEKK